MALRSVVVLRLSGDARAGLRHCPGAPWEPHACAGRQWCSRQLQPRADCFGWSPQEPTPLGLAGDIECGQSAGVARMGNCGVSAQNAAAGATVRLTAQFCGRSVTPARRIQHVAPQFGPRGKPAGPVSRLGIDSAGRTVSTAGRAASDPAHSTRRAVVAQSIRCIRLPSPVERLSAGTGVRRSSGCRRLCWSGRTTTP